MTALPYKIAVIRHCYTPAIMEISRHIPNISILLSNGRPAYQLFDLTDEQVVLLKLKYNFIEFENDTFGAMYKFINWIEGINSWAGSQTESRLIEIFNIL